MSITKVHTHKGLTLDVRQGAETIEVLWNGRSTAREPGTFIGPILTEVLRTSTATNASVLLDFRALEYMNSSTITPVIRILHEAKKGSNRLLILYRNDASWQELSFSALTIFQTDDKRIEIRGN